MTNTESYVIIGLKKSHICDTERRIFVLDVQKLKGKIIEKGKSIEGVSTELGINPATFYRKLKNNSFEIGEADKLVDILSLTGEEASAIFFSQLVA